MAIEAPALERFVKPLNPLEVSRGLAQGKYTAMDTALSALFKVKPAQEVSHTRYENLNGEQEAFVRKALKVLDPNGRVAKFVTRVSFKPDLPAAAEFKFDRSTRKAEIIIGSISSREYPREGDVISFQEGYVKGEFLNTLFHEMCHLFNPLHFIKRDADGAPIRNEDGLVVFEQDGIELFGSEANIRRALRAMLRTALQAEMTGTPVNDYQRSQLIAASATRGLRHARLSRAVYAEGHARVLQEKADASGDPADRKAADDARRVADAELAALYGNELDSALSRHSFISEGWTETMADALFKPKVLKARVAEQRSVWRRGGFKDSMKHLDHGPTLGFIDAAREARETIKTCLGVDQRGLERIRSNARHMIASQRVRMPAFGG